MRFKFLEKKFSSKKGFTLVELIVVISITVIFTSILLVYSRKSDDQIVFYNQTSLFLSTLLRAKASSLETFQPTQFPPNTPQELVCGWGVYVHRSLLGRNDPQGFALFRDLSASGFVGCDLNDPRIGRYDGEFGGPDQRLQDFILPPSVRIKCLSLDNLACPGGLGEMSVVFQPPDPTVALTSQSDTLNHTEAYIILSLLDESRCSRIKINKFGQVTQKNISCQTLQ